MEVKEDKGGSFIGVVLKERKKKMKGEGER